MTEHNPETGEVLSDDDDSGFDARNVTAADGFSQPKRSALVSEVIRMLEEGEFNVDASDAMVDLCKAMEAHAHNNKGVAKGRLTIDIDFSLANSIFVTVGNFKVKKPVSKRMGTPLFLGEKGTLGRNPPGQSAFFGDREERKQLRDA